MIYVTGDTHRKDNVGKLILFAKEHPDLTKKDYVIIAGDFGAVWCKETLEDDLKIYEELPFTILFVDGNHENFNMLESYPIELWNGGKVHKIKEDIIHLMRGQVYTIENKLFFTMGGATSTDRSFRREGVSWWPQEKISDADIVEANKNLEKVKFKVDYIITHSCDEKALWYPPLRTRCIQMDVYPENFILSYFEETLEYTHWYFGHYHLDGNLTDKKTVLCHEIYKIV